MAIRDQSDIVLSAHGDNWKVISGHNRVAAMRSNGISDDEIVYRVIARGTWDEGIQMYEFNGIMLEQAEPEEPYVEPMTECWVCGREMPMFSGPGRHITVSIESNNSSVRTPTTVCPQHEQYLLTALKNAVEAVREENHVGYTDKEPTKR